MAVPHDGNTREPAPPRNPLQPTAPGSRRFTRNRNPLNEDTMAIWNKLKTELDRAGNAAREALDDGKLRLEAYRVRQLADKAAQALGYAVFRARQGGQEIDVATYARLSSTLAAHEEEAARLEAEMKANDIKPEPPPASDAPSDAPPAA